MTETKANSHTGCHKSVPKQNEIQPTGKFFDYRRNGECDNRYLNRIMAMRFSLLDLDIKQ